MHKAGFGLVFGFALLLIAGLYLASTLAVVERVAMVDRVVGAPRLFVHGSGAPVPVQARKLVRAGDVIQTGPGESVDLRWARWVGGMRLRVGPESRFIIRKAVASRSSRDEESRLRLDSGTIWVRLRDALTPKSKFEVETPTVVAAVRGTIFRVSVDRGGASRVEVYKGKVEVAGAGGAKTTLTEGAETSLTRTQHGAVSGPLSASHRQEWQHADGISGPLLEVAEPSTDAKLSGQVTVRGRVEPGATLQVNGATVPADKGTGTYQHTLRLPSGAQTLTLRATDARGGETTVTRQVTVQ